MKNLYLPNKCVKCENDIQIEKKEDGAMDAYCIHCDFLLQYTKEEVNQIEIA